ncbi:hypothetical protein MUK42_05871 [Musa troglodytarum]|uniref:Uncharacterized protein n=1 Tax=Musa troglodytarum TaxID=320322 RepID=A0A9E7GAN3_9LILI|nr:hypothetical protein MUK42_05871 [Musa troglodytarum]
MEDHSDEEENEVDDKSKYDDDEKVREQSDTKRNTPYHPISDDTVVYQTTDLENIQKKKEEEKALKGLRAKASQKGSFGGTDLKKEWKEITSMFHLYCVSYILSLGRSSVHCDDVLCSISYLNVVLSTVFVGWPSCGSSVFGESVLETVEWEDHFRVLTGCRKQMDPSANKEMPPNRKHQIFQHNMYLQP